MVSTVSIKSKGQTIRMVDTGCTQTQITIETEKSDTKENGKSGGTLKYSFRSVLHNPMSLTPISGKHTLEYT